jgi:hypothetical protein
MNSRPLTDSSHVLAAFLLTLGCVLVGCESVPTGVRDRFAPPPVAERFEAPREVVLAEAPRALSAQGYRVTSVRLAAGTIEAVSAVQGGGDFRSARQLRAVLQVTTLPDGDTEVAVRMWEVTEEESGRQGPIAAERALSDPTPHRAILAGIARRLAGPAPDESAAR